MDNNVYLDCSDIKPEFAGFLIETSPNMIMECWSGFGENTPKEIMAVYVGSYNFLRTYNKEKLIELHKEKSKNWSNWCDDVLLFYATRNILFGQKIPVIQPENIPERFRELLKY
jgi:hypothetical protein